MKKPKSKKPTPELIDAGNPEWTEEDFQNAVPFSALPESLRNTISSRKRGPQKAPTKELISIRLSHDVLEKLRATGTGWQSRVDEILRKHVELRRA
jgi:uncharacterized protein (DUF4415 family)